jgi:hypothetical protein
MTRMWVAALILTINSAHADVTSIGPDGISSAGLQSPAGGPLNGSGVPIGQVERFRPTKNPPDTAPQNPFVIPEAVFRQDGDAAQDMDNGSHATQVASVMISTNSASTLGVSPQADLYASAYVTQNMPGDPNFVEALGSTQKVVTEGGVHVVNHSYGIAQSGQEADGDSLLTLGLDWMARAHNVLNVVAGEQGDASLARLVPSDNYNGMVVASSEKVGGVYLKVAASNNITKFPTDSQVFTDILAPGEGVLSETLAGDPEVASGTSLAAPHVGGTVALLEQYATAPGSGLTSNALQHEVMKAIMMNSADKLKDFGDGRRLGMTRTVLDEQSREWQFSEAFLDSAIPIDDQFGAGHLNAQRALTQLKGGEYEADTTPVPLIGWDYGLTETAGDFNKYALNVPIQQGMWFATTLAWDRRITMFDSDSDNEYDMGEDFFEDLGGTPESSFNRMWLYVVPAGANDTSQAVHTSVSERDNLQHIFFPIPATGQYEIWIEQLDVHQLDPQESQPYALAWWTAAAPTVQDGDFDMDGDVDADDLDIWSMNFGPNDQGDSDSDDDSDGNDFLVWQRTLGTTSSAAIPEPRGTLLFIVATSAFCFWKRY